MFQASLFIIAMLCATARWICIAHSKTLRFIQEIPFCIPSQLRQDIHRYFEILHTPNPAEVGDHLTTELSQAGVLGSWPILALLMLVSSIPLEQGTPYNLAVYAAASLWTSGMYVIACLPGRSLPECLSELRHDTQGERNNILKSVVLYSSLLFVMGLSLQKGLDIIHENTELPGHSDEMLNGVMFGGGYLMLSVLFAPVAKKCGPFVFDYLTHEATALDSILTCLATLDEYTHARACLRGVGRCLTGTRNGVAGCFSWMGRKCVGFFNKCRDACRQDDRQEVVGQEDEREMVADEQIVTDLSNRNP